MEYKASQLLAYNAFSTCKMVPIPDSVAEGEWKPSKQCHWRPSQALPSLRCNRIPWKSHLEPPLIQAKPSNMATVKSSLFLKDMHADSRNYGGSKQRGKGSTLPAVCLAGDWGHFLLSQLYWEAVNTELSEVARGGEGLRLQSMPTDISRLCVSFEAVSGCFCCRGAAASHRDTELTQILPLIHRETFLQN